MADVDLVMTAVTPTTTTLTTMRTALRRVLHDEDSDAYRWTDDELDRHLARAVRELSQVLPREQKDTLSTTADSRDLSVSSLADLVGVEAVEYPVGNYPPTFVQWSLWMTTLTMLVDGAPSGTEDVYVYWGKLHTLDGSTSTLPTEAEEAVLVGASAYAALEWASYATNRVNVGGPGTWRNYESWGRARLEDFGAWLQKLGKGARVRVSAMYRPEYSDPGQSTVAWEP